MDLNLLDDPELTGLDLDPSFLAEVESYETNFMAS